MKKQLTLSGAIAIMLTGIITFSSCSKSSNSNFTGNYAGTLIDSTSSIFGIADTVIITGNGNTLTITDKNTGASITGTVGSTVTASTGSTATLTITNQSIKVGPNTEVYSSSTPGSFVTSTYAGQSATIVSFSLAAANGNIFDFTGTRF